MTPAVSTLLRDHAFVRGLTDEQIGRLAAATAPVMFEENEIVLADREKSSAFYFVMEGSVAVEASGKRYAVIVQALGPGEVFGWSALLCDQDTLFQVRARERTTALRISGDAMKNLCRADPTLGVELLQRTLRVVASRVRATEERFAEMCGIRL